MTDEHDNRLNVLRRIADEADRILLDYQRRSIPLPPDIQALLERTRDAS